MSDCKQWCVSCAISMANEAVKAMFFIRYAITHHQFIISHNESEMPPIDWPIFYMCALYYVQNEESARNKNHHRRKYYYVSLNSCQSFLRESSF